MQNNLFLNYTVIAYSHILEVLENPVDVKVGSANHLCHVIEGARCDTDPPKCGDSLTDS